VIVASVAKIPLGRVHRRNGVGGQALKSNQHWHRLAARQSHHRGTAAEALGDTRLAVEFHAQQLTRDREISAGQRHQRLCRRRHESRPPLFALTVTSAPPPPICANGHQHRAAKFGRAIAAGHEPA
jgi:hypothetical protein